MVPNCKKQVNMFYGSSNTTSTFSIDCLGYDYAVVDFLIGPGVTSNTNAVASLTLKQCTQASTTGTSAITSCVLGADFTAPNWVAAGKTNTAGTFKVDLRGKERYLIVSMTAATDAGTNVHGFATSLYRGEEGPVGTTKEGCGFIVNC
jgi:hypothetical protein